MRSGGEDAAALARRVIGIGFEGASVGAAPLVALRAFSPGAILLFGRNVGTAEELRTLVGALRSLGTPPPLIAIDQEGGRVARIRTGVTAVPSAMALGAAADPALTGALGALVGRDLAATGITLDLAPVADLALHAGNTVIGNRAYGADPEDVARQAGAFARGLERGGVAATLKHFPGHGDTTVDSHRALPRITADAATLRARDLAPFRSILAAGGASAVLVAHVVAEAFDPDVPATLSRRVVTDLLRGELGFAGLVVTDCLEMDAIGAGAGSAEAAWRALAAGCDLLLFSHTPEVAERAVDGIAAALARGDLAAERLREAAGRVDALRERYAIPDPAAASYDPELPVRAARRAVTALRGAPRLAADVPVTVISFEGGAAEGIEAGERREGDTLAAALRPRRVRAEVMRVPLAPGADELELLLETLALQVAQGPREIALVTRRADLHPAQGAAVARVLAAHPDALVVSAREPYDALLWPAARRVVAIYGDDPLAFAGLADVLVGRADAAGRLPLALEALAAP